MYEDFYGFRTKPFSILPDAQFLYLSRGHRYALSLLEYGLGGQTGFTVVTGEIGSGKTTLVQHLLGKSAANHTIGLITNTAELNRDLMKWLLHAYGIDHRGADQVGQYQAFVDFVKQKYEAGCDCVLIIDEAQHLGPESLEALRLLSNINSGKDHLLKILLVGQPELLETLARPDLVQFRQRISANFHLKPLGLLETREYIRYRLKVAGGDETLFDDLSCDFIHIVGGGIPRQINLLCDTALIYGYADSRHDVDLDTVVGVLRDRASFQSLASVPPLGDLARTSIETLIREVREKEFARESALGLSRDRSSPSPSAGGMIAAAEPSRTAAPNGDAIAKTTAPKDDGTPSAKDAVAEAASRTRGVVIAAVAANSGLGSVAPRPPELLDGHPQRHPAAPGAGTLERPAQPFVSGDRVPRVRDVPASASVAAMPGAPGSTPKRRFEPIIAVSGNGSKLGLGGATASKPIELLPYKKDRAELGRAISWPRTIALAVLFVVVLLALLIVASKTSNAADGAVRTPIAAAPGDELRRSWTDTGRRS